MSPDDHRIVGAYLGNVRRKGNVTQAELARRLAKPQSFVSSYERGQRRIDFLEFVQVMLALGEDPAAAGTKLLKQLAPEARKRMSDAGPA